MIRFLNVFEQEGYFMRLLRIFSMTMILAGTLTVSATAQKKPPRRTTPKPPAARTLPPLDVRVGREKVEIQRSNVARFIDVLGPIAQEIENTSSTTDRNVDPKILQKNEQNKQRVIAAIRNLRAGIAMLESEFRTKTLLRPYLKTLEGITDLAAQSEDAALAGRFVASKEPLRDILKKLIDTLNTMPQG
jgi:hypothetical protein